MQQAFADFQTSLNRVRNLANDASANTPAALSDPALLERHETAMSAVVVTLSGYFESFLRGTAEEYANQINQLNHPFTALKANIRYAHLQGGGQLLNHIGGKKRSNRHNWTTADAKDVAERLVSVYGGGSYQLVWEAFAETKGNPGPDTVKEFLRRFGVAAPLETLSQAAGFSVTTPLQSFIDVRNECAHNGQANQTPQPSGVLAYCDLLEKIAQGIVDTLSAHQVNQSGAIAPIATPLSLPLPMVVAASSPSTSIVPVTSATPATRTLLGRLLNFFKRT